MIISTWLSLSSLARGFTPSVLPMPTLPKGGQLLPREEGQGGATQQPLPPCWFCPAIGWLVFQQCPSRALDLLNRTWKHSPFILILSYCLILAWGNCDEKKVNGPEFSSESLHVLGSAVWAFKKCKTCPKNPRGRNSPALEVRRVLDSALWWRAL